MPIDFGEGLGSFAHDVEVFGLCYAASLDVSFGRCHLQRGLGLVN